MDNKNFCKDCGQVHDKDLDKLADMSSKMAGKFTDDSFPLIWREAKEEFKDMSKKELAQNMFYTGATQMLAAFIRMMHNEFIDPEYMKLKTDEERYKFLIKCDEEPMIGEFSNFGQILEEKGDIEKAENIYKREKELYSGDFNGYVNLGLLYKKMKNSELARNNLNIALDLALKQQKEDPDCIDQEVIDYIRKELEDILEK